MFIKQIPKIQNHKNEFDKHRWKEPASVLNKDWEDDNTKRKQKKGNDEAAKTSSSLSLHIECYEKSLEVGTQQDTHDTPTTVPDISSVTTCFDTIPRRREEHFAPEVMKFKSSEKLLYVAPKTSTPDAQPTEYERLKAHANKLYEAQEYLAAVKAYNEILANVKMTAHETAIIYSNRAATYLKLLQFKHALNKAKNDAKSTISCSPEWWKGHFQLASYYIELEMWQEAHRHLLKSYSLNSTSNEVIKALTKVKDGLIESQMNYQQHRMLNRMRKLDLFHCNEDSSEEEEVKRSGGNVDDSHFDFNERIHGYSDVDNVSLVSDRQSPINEFPNVVETLIITLDDESSDRINPSSTENQQQPPNAAPELNERSSQEKELFTKIEKTDYMGGNNTQHLLHVFNVNNCNDSANILSSVPKAPPYANVLSPTEVQTQPGYYRAIVKSDSIVNIKDHYHDQLDPWTSRGCNNVHYYNIGLFQREEGLRAVIIKNKQRIEDASYIGRLFVATHPKFPFVSKMIFSATSVNNLTPATNTFVVVIYDIKEACTLTLKNALRLLPSQSDELKNYLSNRTPTASLTAYNDNGVLLGDGRREVVNLKQVETLAKHMKDRVPTKKQGAPKMERTDIVNNFVKNKNFVECRYQSGQSERIFLGNSTCFNLFENSLLSKNEVQQMVNDAKALIYSLRQEKLEKAKNLIDSPAYVETKGVGIYAIDTTFNLGRMHVTILLYTSPNFVNSKGEPAKFIGAIMLSTHRTKEDYLWMAQEIQKLVKSPNKVARVLITDGDPALDAFMHIPIFQAPCVRLTCGEHLQKNFETTYCKENQSPVFDLFGTTKNEVKSAGLFDEFTFEHFREKVQQASQTAAWQANPVLMAWSKNEAKMRLHFDRYNLVHRIAGGYGFDAATTNFLEGLNMLLKSEINNHTALQFLITKLQYYVDKQMAKAAMAFVSTYPLQFRDESKYIGPLDWKKLSAEAKMDKLKSEGLIDMDSNSSFTCPAFDFPPGFAPYLSQQQRYEMVVRADGYGVAVHPLDSTSYIVGRGVEARVVFTRRTPFECTCNYLQKKMNLCEHLLAVNLKFPHLKLFDRMAEFLQKEHPDYLLKRLAQKSDGAKPTSRRDGNPKTRNSKVHNEHIIDATADNGKVFKTNHVETLYEDVLEINATSDDHEQQLFSSRTSSNITVNTNAQSQPSSPYPSSSTSNYQLLRQRDVNNAKTRLPRVPFSSQPSVSTAVRPQQRPPLIRVLRPVLFSTAAAQTRQQMARLPPRFTTSSQVISSMCPQVLLYPPPQPPQPKQK